MTDAFEFEDAIFINLTVGRDSLDQFIRARITITPELQAIEWYALRVLFTHPESHTLTTLSELFGKKANSFTHVVKNLKDYEYIFTDRHPFDRRKSVLKLSDKAITIREDFLEQAKSIDREITTYLGNQVEILLQHLRLLKRLST